MIRYFLVSNKILVVTKFHDVFGSQFDSKSKIREDVQMQFGCYFLFK